MIQYINIQFMLSTIFHYKLTEIEHHMSLAVRVSHLVLVKVKTNFHQKWVCFMDLKKCLSHVTPFLQKLHWLPITYRILFKYNLITFKAIKFSQPIYLSPLIKTSCLTCGNRLSLSSVSHKEAIGKRGFAMASPTEWNRLPQSVRSQQTITGFRSQLKTYLFRLAYPSHHSTSPWRVLIWISTCYVPGLSLFEFKRIRGCYINFALYKCFYSILYHYIN